MPSFDPFAGMKNDLANLTEEVKSLRRELDALKGSVQRDAPYNRRQ